MLANIIATSQEYWKLIVAAATGVGGLLNWYRLRKKSKLKSAEELLIQFEKTKSQLILHMVAEIQATKDIIERDKLLEVLRVQCPSCFQAALKEYGSERLIVKYQTEDD